MSFIIDDELPRGCCHRVGLSFSWAYTQHELGVFWTRYAADHFHSAEVSDACWDDIRCHALGR